MKLSNILASICVAGILAMSSVAPVLAADASPVATIGETGFSTAVAVCPTQTLYIYFENANPPFTVTVKDGDGNIVKQGKFTGTGSTLPGLKAGDVVSQITAAFGNRNIKTCKVNKIVCTNPDITLPGQTTSGATTVITGGTPAQPGVPARPGKPAVPPVNAVPPTVTTKPGTSNTKFDSLLDDLYAEVSPISDANAQVDVAEPDCSTLDGGDPSQITCDTCPSLSDELAILNQLIQ